MAKSEVIFEDYTIKVQNAIDDKINAELAGVSGELVAAVVRNYDTFPRVDTGKTKNSFKYKVVESEHTSHIGSDYENAIWEEFGTGDYALEGNGRKGGWAYEDPETGERIWTHGKRPGRHFWKAYNSMKNKIIKRFQEAFKGL